MPAKICIGAIFKIFDDEAKHFKFHIIVGEDSGQIGTIFINTEARYGDLAAGAQASQLPLSCHDHSFLQHDSFADCSMIKDCNKSEINGYIQKNPGHHLGNLSASILENIIRIINNSKVLEVEQKKKYGFGHK